MFELLHSFIWERNIDFNIIKPQLAVHLSGLLNKCNAYFPELTTEQATTHIWITPPFSENIEAKLPFTVSSKLLEEFIDISSGNSLRTRFNEMPLETFWCECLDEYGTVSSAALKVLIPFNTSYLFEVGFSSMTSMKKKYQARMNIAHDIHVCLLKIPPAS